ncbi:transcription termination/antitermination protein NusG [Planctomycetales bacterium]|nr:transcription termination/antitermination protein NusG [Planctomycetales bacterium]GHT01718.1 transcription termination/antitermination protein NusG [Planctomycetales bacterium]GHT02684.1 transcription termination/antitermination protein NusG [Planctomycetales bacterium]
MSEEQIENSGEVGEEAVAAEEAAEPAVPVLSIEERAAKNWYVIKVQPEREDRIQNLLEEQIRRHGLQAQIRDILVPKEHLQEVRHSKKRISRIKSYPGYLFVEMDLSDEVFFIITEIDGVSGFVSADPLKPEKLPTNEMIKVLRDMENQKDKPKAKVEFTVGQRVRVKEGPFENFEGVVEEVYPDKGKIKVTIHIFGRGTPVELEFIQVEKM